MSLNINLLSLAWSHFQRSLNIFGHFSQISTLLLRQRGIQAGREEGDHPNHRHQVQES